MSDLRPGELVPVLGGQWSGLLFDNPKLGLAAELSWSFTFAFADVDREYGGTPVSVSLDWVPLTAASWRGMAGQQMRCDRFAEPAEASVYFFDHHRYERVDLRIREQRDTTIHATVELSGDLDGLGLPTFTAAAWLTFAGIRVQVSTASTADEALARLGDFSDVTGLSPAPDTVRGFMFRRPVPAGVIRPTATDSTGYRRGHGSIPCRGRRAWSAGGAVRAARLGGG